MHFLSFILNSILETDQDVCIQHITSKEDKENFLPRKHKLKLQKMLLVVGIDVSKDDFHCCAKIKEEDGRVKIIGSRAFSNDYKGFDDLHLWVSKRIKKEYSIRYIMEATGSYFEDLAYYLHAKNGRVSVVLANKIKHFAKSLNIKTKTDKVDSAMIAQIGIERELDKWEPMSPQYKKLRDLSRELLSIKKEKSRALCQRHAMEHSHNKLEEVLIIKNKQISFYQDTIKEIETQIRRIVEEDPDLKQRIGKIQKVKGLGMITIVTVICETNGFLLFSSIRQVISYAGLDVKINESGNFSGKTRISKKGNARIRQSLYMPAVSAATHNEKIKILYERINEKNPQTKRKGVIAAMRKLLILIFVLWKKNKEYNPNYSWATNAADDAKLLETGNNF